MNVLERNPRFTNTPIYMILPWQEEFEMSISWVGSNLSNPLLQNLMNITYSQRSKRKPWFSPGMSRIRWFLENPWRQNRQKPSPARTPLTWDEKVGQIHVYLVCPTWVPEYRPSTSHLHGDICIYVYIYGEILGSSGVNLTNTKNILGLCKKWEQEPTMTWGYGPWGFNGEVMEHNGAVYDELFFMSQHQKSDKTAMKRWDILGKTPFVQPCESGTLLVKAITNPQNDMW